MGPLHKLLYIIYNPTIQNLIEFPFCGIVFYLPIKRDARNELTREMRSVLSYCSGRSLAIFAIWAPVNLSYAEDPMQGL